MTAGATDGRACFCCLRMAWLRDSTQDTTYTQYLCNHVWPGYTICYCACGCVGVQVGVGVGVGVGGCCPAMGDGAGTQGTPFPSFLAGSPLLCIVFLGLGRSSFPTARWGEGPSPSRLPLAQPGAGGSSALGLAQRLLETPRLHPPTSCRQHRLAVCPSPVQYRSSPVTTKCLLLRQFSFCTAAATIELHRHATSPTVPSSLNTTFVSDMSCVLSLTTTATLHLPASSTFACFGPLQPQHRCQPLRCGTHSAARPCHCPLSCQISSLTPVTTRLSHAGCCCYSTPLL